MNQIVLSFRKLKLIIWERWKFDFRNCLNYCEVFESWNFKFYKVQIWDSKLKNWKVKVENFDNFWNFKRIWSNNLHRRKTFNIRSYSPREKKMCTSVHAFIHIFISIHFFSRHILLFYYNFAHDFHRHFIFTISQNLVHISPLGFIIILRNLVFIHIFTIVYFWH